MPQLTIRPGPGLRGRARLPGDKSISHRAVLFGALAEGTTHIRHFLPSNDCWSTVRCTRSLGVPVSELSDTELLVHGRGLHGFREPDDVLNCGNSGTTVRLLAGLLAGQPFTSFVSGSAQLRRRPMFRIVVPLRQVGATIHGRDEDRLLPLLIRGGRLRGIQFELPIASAQVKSAILLAGLFADGPMVVREPGPARDHTERLLRAMGADVRINQAMITVVPRDQPLTPLDLEIPGDFSSAAFIIVAACVVPHSEVLLEGVGINTTRTGLLDVLREIGAHVKLENEREMGGEPVGDLVVRSGEYVGVEVGGGAVPRMIDEFPILAVAATQAQGTTLVRDAAELRVKESDRIASTVGELRKMGARIEETPDGFVVEGPTPLKGAVVDSHDDHRLAMALVVAGLIAQGETTVRGTACIDDSFPGFAEIMTSLGADIVRG